MSTNLVQIGTVVVTSEEASVCYKLAQQFNTPVEGIALLRANRNNGTVKGGMVAALCGAQAHETVRAHKGNGFVSFVGWLVAILTLTAVVCYVGQGITIIHVLGY